jgi:hypothetical protein
VKLRENRGMEKKNYMKKSLSLYLSHGTFSLNILMSVIRTGYVARSKKCIQHFG